MLILIKKLDKKDKWGACYGLYRCECGNEKEILIKNVKYKLTKSCGCLKNQLSGNAARTHGMSKTSEFSSWKHMKYRCYNENCKEYHNYGGRGIIICDRWKNSFENFLEDMELKPEPKEKYSIERRNNNGNYEPTNCYWGTRKIQANNRRYNDNIIYNNKEQTLTQWSKELNIQRETLWYRLYKYNWSIEKTFTTPVRKHIIEK